MAWVNGGPGSKIPIAVKREVDDRQGNRCTTVDATVCTGRIDEYDHMHNVKALGIDRAEANHPDQIQGLCIPCHKVKTQAEALAGRLRSRRRPVQHLGLAL